MHCVHGQRRAHWRRPRLCPWPLSCMACGLHVPATANAVPLPACLRCKCRARAWRRHTSPCVDQGQVFRTVLAGMLLQVLRCHTSPCVASAALAGFTLPLAGCPPGPWLSHPSRVHCSHLHHACPLLLAQRGTLQLLPHHPPYPHPPPHPTPTPLVLC